MKKIFQNIVIVLCILVNISVAEDLPVIFPYQQDKDSTPNSTRLFIPTIISEEEKAELKIIEEKRQKKISETFVSKESIEKTEKIKTEIVTKTGDEDFFNSLDDEKNKPVNME